MHEDDIELEMAKTMREATQRVLAKMAAGQHGDAFIEAARELNRMLDEERQVAA